MTAESSCNDAESIQRLLRLYLARRHEPVFAQWHRDCARECIRALREIARRPTETPESEREALIQAAHKLRMEGRYAQAALVTQMLRRLSSES